MVFPLLCSFSLQCRGPDSVLLLFVHLDSGCEAILIANLHSIFLCVSNQQGILAALIFPSAFLVLLFMYSIRSSALMSAVSMSSSVSSMTETSLSWSHSVFELLPSSVSPSELGWRCFSLRLFHRSLTPHHCSFFLVAFLLLCFRFVSTMRRSISRCVDLVIFSCSFERVHVPEAYVTLG